MSLKVFALPVLVSADDRCAGVHSGPAHAERAGGEGGARVDGQVRDPPGAGPPDDVLAPRADWPSFDGVYEEHFAFVWRSLRLLGVADDVLEDAAQDVFAVVSRQLPEFAGRSSLSTWLFAIVQHTAANYRRKHRRKLAPLVPLAEGFVGHEPTPHAHAEATEVALVIEEFCAGLSPDRRALFVLALVEELPAPEVARALGIPINTVYSRVRALRAGIGRALGLGEEEHD